MSEPVKYVLGDTVKYCFGCGMASPSAAEGCHKCGGSDWHVGTPYDFKRAVLARKGIPDVTRQGVKLRGGPR